MAEEQPSVEMNGAVLDRMDVPEVSAEDASGGVDELVGCVGEITRLQRDCGCEESDTCDSFKDNLKSCQEFCACFTTVMSICDSMRALILAPVAGPSGLGRRFCRCFYLTLAIGTIMWFFLGAYRFYEGPYQNKIIETDTQYLESISFPDIYFCFPGQVVYNAMIFPTANPSLHQSEPASGFVVGGFGGMVDNPRASVDDGWEQDMSQPPCNGLAEYRVLDSGEMSTKCATHPIAASLQTTMKYMWVNKTMDPRSGSNLLFSNNTLPLSNYAAQLAASIPVYTQYDSTTGIVTKVPGQCFQWRMKGGYEASRESPSYLVNDLYTTANQALIQGAKATAMQVYLVEAGNNPVDENGKIGYT